MKVPSYPLLAIAKRWQVPYHVVLLVADDMAHANEIGYCTDHHDDAYEWLAADLAGKQITFEITQWMQTLHQIQTGAIEVEL